MLTPELDVLYSEGSFYTVVVKDDVMSIGKSVFEQCSRLTSVTFPEGLTSIGEEAFAFCTGLTSVTFPEGLTSIGKDAFAICTGLTSVTFPEGLTSIGESILGLHAHPVTFPEGLTSIGRMHSLVACDLDDLSRRVDQHRMACIQWLHTGLASVAFPDGLTSIGESAFVGCTGLTSVTFPKV